MSKEIRVNYKEAYKEYERIKELFDKEDIVYSLTGSMRRKKKHNRRYWYNNKGKKV